MKITHISSARVLCAVLTATLANVAVGQVARGVDCPRIEDQFVRVSPGRAATITIAGEYLGNSEISIFGYPLGGDLLQTGPRDFVFVPDDGFTGSTTFTYRITPPSECPESYLLGRVTLAGGSTGQPFVTPDSGLCGLGLMGPALAFCGCVGLGRRRHRRGL